MGNGITFDQYGNPDWGAAPGNTPAPASTSTRNPNDFWGLGDLYGEPILMGIDPANMHPITTNGQDVPIGRMATTHSASAQVVSTQKFYQNVTKLFQQQADDRRKNPKGPTGFEQFQAELAAAGFYGQSDYANGRMDGRFLSALHTAVATYEAQAHANPSEPKSFTQFLASNTNGGTTGSTDLDSAAAAAAAAQAPPPGPSLTDPNALNTQVQNAAQDALGRALSKDELSRFVQSFHGAESSAFYTQQAGGSAYTNPNPTDDAAAFVQSQHPDEYRQHQATAYMDAFMNMMLGGTRSASPNQPVVAPVGGTS